MVPNAIAAPSAGTTMRLRSAVIGNVVIGRIPGLRFS
jgi:hypothetical protein